LQDLDREFPAQVDGEPSKIIVSQELIEIEAEQLEHDALRK
jgi:hypothetical protein